MAKASTERAESGAVAMRAVVAGRVQGVGFRDATQRRARRLGAMGWVRNGDDGAVLVHVEGPEAAVEELVAFLREGPHLHHRFTRTAPIPNKALAWGKGANEIVIYRHRHGITDKTDAFGKQPKAP